MGRLFTKDVHVTIINGEPLRTCQVIEASDKLDTQECKDVVNKMT